MDSEIKNKKGLAPVNKVPRNGVTEGPYMEVPQEIYGPYGPYMDFLPQIYGPYGPDMDFLLENMVRTIKILPF